MTTILFGTILPWLLIAVGTWLGYQLVQQNGRILLRLEAIEKRLAPRREEKQRQPEALPLGSAAPEFELTDLSGGRRKLSEFRGRDVLLVFFNPRCGFCTKMADDLAALPTEGGHGQAVPLVVTTGDADENRKLIKLHGIRCTVLLQQEMEVASRYRAQGTPMGYRIDAEGRIASELTIGAEPLLKLSAWSEPHPPLPKPSGNGTAHGKEPDPSLARSRLNRNGLKAGTIAPDFQLPRIDGGELALAELRGERVLLVFSDPECGPCMELAPRLEGLHRRRGDLQVVMVSRREIEANRTKAGQLGLTFPIVLQRTWEISREYGMFATPVGYLIDEQGLIAKDVAVGVEPILSLAEEPGAVESQAPRVRTEPAWAN